MSLNFGVNGMKIQMSRPKKAAEQTGDQRITW